MISAAALKELYCSCSCVSALRGSAQMVFWYSLNNCFVEIDGKGSTTDMQRGEHSVLGMGQGSEELPVTPGCQSCSICVVRLGKFSLKIFSYWEEASVRTDITAASSFANLGAFSTPGK